MRSNPAVLIIDDNVAMAENLQEILEDEGVRVDLATDGYEAMRKLDEASYDLVITDVRMPGMNGIEVLKAVNERWPRLPVLVMTAYSADTLMEEAYTEGALDVLPKPVDIEQVIGLVTRVADADAPVLLVEDDRDLRVTLAEALLDVAKVVPHTTSSMAGARRLAEELRFRVAIIDVRLPDGNGVVLAHELQAAYPDLQIIYITGLSFQRGELEGVPRSPQMRLLEKPFDPTTLIELVRSAV